MEKGSEKATRILKIAITGPESTGKSMLAEQLAAYFNTRWVPEFAREYLDNLDRNYEQNDILRIAKGQLSTEKHAEKTANKFLFCDTDFLVTKIWSEHAFGNCPPWITKQFLNHRYDLYLLTNIDIPWEYDIQREHPDMRNYFFNWYHKELITAGFPFSVVSGTGVERFENTIALIRKYFII